MNAWNPSWSQMPWRFFTNPIERFKVICASTVQDSVMSNRNVTIVTNVWNKSANSPHLFHQNQWEIPKYSYALLHKCCHLLFYRCNLEKLYLTNTCQQTSQAISKSPILHLKNQKVAILGLHSVYSLSHLS